MRRVCEYFEKKGHRTILTMGDKTLDRGFIHSLGHGIGLTIGEEPYLTLGEREELERGMVATVEPGLYYPELGGVRIEDVVVIEPDGAREVVKHRKELTL